LTFFTTAAAMTTKRKQADDDAVVKRARVDYDTLKQRNISIYVIGPTKDRILWVSNYRYSAWSDPEFQRQFDLVYKDLAFGSAGMSAELFHIVRLWIEKCYYTEVGIPSEVNGDPLYFRYVVLHPPSVDEMVKFATHILGEYEPIDCLWPVRCPDYCNFSPSERARVHEGMRRQGWDFCKFNDNLMYFSRVKSK
jgi:hypothetical protein